MASERRIGSEDSETRSALLDAAQKLMLEEGYPGVTSRRVAATAGLKPQPLHYYFRTMDDLYLALFRRGRSEAHTSDLQPLTRISYALFCLHKTPPHQPTPPTHHIPHLPR